MSYLYTLRCLSNGCNGFYNKNIIGTPSHGSSPTADFLKKHQICYPNNRDCTNEEHIRNMENMEEDKEVQLTERR